LPDCSAWRNEALDVVSQLDWDSLVETVAAGKLRNQSFLREVLKQTSDLLFSGVGYLVRYFFQADYPIGMLDAEG
jgi:hypothetical protein